MSKTLRQQEGVRRDTQGGVMMKATPAPSLVVTQAKLLFQFLIVPFDAPAHLGDPDQIHKRGMGGQCRQPVLGRFSFTAGPFDQQPLLLTKLLMSLITMGRTHPQPRKTRRQYRVRALAPVDRAPSARFQGFGQRLDAERRGARLAPPSRRWPPDSLARLGGHRPRAGRPHRGDRLHTHAIAQPQLTELLAPTCFIAVA